MQTTVRTLSSGDTVDLGDLVTFKASESNGSLRFIAVSRGDPTGYVVVTRRFGDGDDINVPADGCVLAVTDGRGMGNPTAWLLIPEANYGGAE